MRYFVYCRKSSEEESKQIQSLSTQENLLKEYASKQDLSIIEFIKESKSARFDGNRPLFSLMLERIRKGEADAILTLHVDRLSRNELEFGMLAKLLAQGLIKEIRTPAKIYSTYNDLMYIGFEFIFAAHYSRALSVRVKEGIQTKLNKGEYPTMAPIGYTNDNGKIYPDKNYVSFIKDVYELYSTGNHSLKEMTKILFNNGYRTKTGKKFAKNSLYRILTNPVYLGLIRRNGQTYQGIHKPLITRSLYDQVQSIFTNLNRSKKQKLDFIFRPFLSCGVCGCRLTASRKKGKYDYYYCTNGKGICSQHLQYLTRARVQEILQALVDGFTLDEELANLSFEIYTESLSEAAKNESSTVAIIQNQINNIDKKIDSLLELKLDKKISQDLFDSKLHKLNEDKTELKNQLKTIKNQEYGTTLELVEDIKNKAVELSEVFRDGDDEVKSD